MIRIRGQVGQWPVDLSIELDDDDWAQLASHLHAASVVTPVAPVMRREAADPLWEPAQQLLRDAGLIEGPQLLAELEALAGDSRAAKRLLVRLRHSEEVKVESGTDAPVYRWVS